MDAVDLLRVLSQLGAFDLTLHRTDGVLAVAIVDLPEDRRVLAVERTYRPGVSLILDPTPEEVTIAREGDLWQLWNSERAKDLYSIEQTGVSHGH